jgi:uncharacterized phiE125 gp8 family phage protein
MAIKLITAPASEPVTLAEAKLHLRVVDSDEDSMITMMISAARLFAESYTNRSLITQTWKWVGDYFPNELELERGPVQSITNIQYLDMSAASQTVVPATPNYVLALAGDFPRLAPGFGYTWPETLPQIQAVSCTYVAGYGSAASSVPEGIRNWILARVNTMYEQREELAGSTRMTVASIPYFDRLLDPYCAWSA